MEKTVSAQKIWEVLMKDKEFAAQPEPTLKATRPFIDAIPGILKDMLNVQATLSNLSKAKVAFLRYCLDHDYIKIMVDAMPDEALGFFDREDLPGMFESMLDLLIDSFEPLVENALAILKARGVTEDQLMTGPNVGLSGKALKLYRAKKLTIADLLELQPGIIVKNSNK
jgi:hypothetical protein